MTLYAVHAFFASWWDEVTQSVQLLPRLAGEVQYFVAGTGLYLPVVCAVISGIYADNTEPSRR